MNMPIALTIMPIIEIKVYWISKLLTLFSSLPPSPSHCSSTKQTSRLYFFVYFQPNFCCAEVCFVWYVVCTRMTSCSQISTL